MRSSKCVQKREREREREIEEIKGKEGEKVTNLKRDRRGKEGDGEFSHRGKEILRTRETLTHDRNSSVQEKWKCHKKRKMGG